MIASMSQFVSPAPERVAPDGFRTLCRRGRLAGAGIGALLAVLIVPAIATAAPPRYQMKADQTVRISPSTAATAMGTVFSGELVEIQCQDRGTSVGGSTLWDYIQYDVDGTDGLVKRGWVPDYYVKTGTTEPLDGVKQGDCPAPLTEPGAPAEAPSPDGDDESADALPPACNPKPAVQDLRMTARAKGHRKVTTRYGKRVRVRGKLSTLAGDPLAGQWVCVVSKDDKPHAQLRARRYVLTGADGSITFRTRKGPSQRIWFVHPTTGGKVAASVSVQVRAPVKLRASDDTLRNRETMFLRGSVGGRGQSGRTLVELQAKRGNHWQTFGTTRTDGDGSYSFPYTFRRTVGTVRYHLRARVPAQKGLPYAAGNSRPITVKVRGD